MSIVIPLYVYLCTILLMLNKKKVKKKKKGRVAALANVTASHALCLIAVLLQAHSLEGNPVQTKGDRSKVHFPKISLLDQRTVTELQPQMGQSGAPQVFFPTCVQRFRVFYALSDTSPCDPSHRLHWQTPSVLFFNMTNLQVAHVEVDIKCTHTILKNSRKM